MKKRSGMEIFFLLFSLMVFIFLIYKNCNKTVFFDASLMQILTLMLAIFVSFFVVQKLTDKRRKIDLLEQQLSDIQDMIINNKYIFSFEDKKRAGILQKSILNKTKHVKEYSFPQVRKDLEYVNDSIIELKELYDGHNMSKEDLCAVSDDIFRLKINISDKIDKIKLMLYEL